MYDRQLSRSRSPKPKGRGGRRRGAKGGIDGPDGRRFKPHHTTTVPKVTDLGAKFSSGDNPATTAMLRNIPNKYTHEHLLEEIDAQGFSGSYNFFYLPIDVKNNANVGYAFINFTHASDFARFCADFKDYHFKRSGSKKIATVSPAIVQGLQQNIENLMKKRVVQGQHGPMLLHEGRRISLDEAMKIYKNS